MKRTSARLLTAAFVAAILAVMALLASGCGSSGEEAEAEPVVAVTTAKAKVGDIARTVTATGSVGSKSQATVSPKVGGPIASMPVLQGKYVHAGDVIATIESRDLRAAASEADAAVREAEAALKEVQAGTNPQGNAERQRALADAEAALRNAETVYARKKMLYDRGGIPKKELDDAQLALETARNEAELARRELQLTRSTLNLTNARQAEARLAQARERAANAHAQLDYATVRSPIDGIVTQQYHYKGDYVASGEKLVDVVDTAQKVVKAQVPDDAATPIETGARTEVHPASGGETVHGTVELVTHAVDPASRMVEVWIGQLGASPELRPGEFAKVSIVTEDAENVVLVPPSAVTLESPTAETGIVMVVDDTNVAHEVEVKVGVRTADAIQIVEGVAAGQTVIVEGNYALPDGTKVRPVEASSGGEEGGAE